ncbi:MAG: nitroreductase family protein [Rhizobacter sp.]|jgi:nitroreductase
MQTTAPSFKQLQGTLRQRVPFLYGLLRQGRHRMHWWAKMRYYLHDMKHAVSHMFWDQRVNTYEKLSAELIFQFHKLEKGLCMPGKPRFFGRDPVMATCRLVERWKAQGFAQNDPVFVGAIETLRAYRTRLGDTPPPAADAGPIFEALERALMSVPPQPEFATPRPYRQTDAEVSAMFDQLCQDRRSVRAFDSRVVPLPVLEGAIQAAQLSPSACNRQPCRVHVYRDRERIDSLLKLQNGNAGFGHMLNTLLVIAADGNSFFDASERNEPYVDGGLFSMSLILALQARGVATCCLNWCVSPATDLEAHRRGDIPAHHKIIMYLAVGYPLEGALAPKSARRPTDSIVRIH